jgi:hypothetical protein
MANWKHIDLTEDELKIIVKDVYDAKIFTSLHIREYDNYLIGSIFMPVLFLGAPPSEPSFPTPTGNIKKDRKNKLLQFDKIDEWKKEYKQWEDETEIREAFIENIGMVYEENSKAGPRSINGYPIFFGCKIVSKEDTKRFMDLYNKYAKMREDFEKQW